MPVEALIDTGVDKVVAAGNDGSGGKEEVRVMGTILSLESCADVDIGSNDVVVVVVDCCGAGDEGNC